MSVILEITLYVLEVFAVLPYWALFYSKVSLSIRLLFVCLIELLCLGFMFVAQDLTDGAYFWYGIFVYHSIELNLSIILIIWLYKKLKR